MPDPRRIKRLEKVILQTVAPMVSHELKDPRLKFVTITRIRPSISSCSFEFRSPSSSAVRSTISNRTGDGGLTTCRGSPSMLTNVVRKAS